MPVLLVLIFIVVPLIELYVIVQVGELIGVLPTIALLVLMSVVGGWLVKREGLRAWRRFRSALGEGRLPTGEVVDGALVLFGGALMLTPGFVSDVLGLALVIPPTRAVVSRAVRSRTRIAFLMPGPRRKPTAPPRRPGAATGPGRDAPPPPRSRPADNSDRDDTIDVEVVKVERNTE